MTSVRSMTPVSVPSAEPDQSQQLLRDVLSVMRTHMKMEVAFVSRVSDGRRYFEHVDADLGFCPVAVGESDEIADSYCGRVLTGQIPGLIIDAAREPGVSDLEATWSLPVGSHLSVPVHTEDGGVFGTLCCFSRHVNPDLTADDLEAMRLFAAIVGKHLEPIVARQRSKTLAQERITEVLDEGRIAMALQPIVDLRLGEVCGYEALARFPGTPSLPPNAWFEVAEQVGMGTALESAAVHAALRQLPRIPEECSLAVNVSATALMGSASIPELFGGAHGHRLVLELTEHQQIADQEHLLAVLSRVREAGVRIAVDDAGSGYAGLERILSLAPEVLKLDRTLVHGVAGHPGRQAMCEAMARFTDRTGARLVAEGIETQQDLDVLRALGVTHGQGFLLGRPTVWD
jgi:EAL domain-containing protein (putative c-di-GMP-specific phosphodiesterase class I)